MLLKIVYTTKWICADKALRISLWGNPRDRHFSTQLGHGALGENGTKEYRYILSADYSIATSL